MKYAVADFGDRLWMISTQLATGVNFQGWVQIDEGMLYKRVGWKRINRESPWKVYGGS